MNGAARYADRLMGFDHLSAERFISLSTERRSGARVATPVWFAQVDDALVVGTFSDSGKVKRLRNSSEVRIAPCNFRGLVKGPYLTASARLLDEDRRARADEALSEKYGWQWHMFSRHVDAFLVIEPTD